MSRTNVNPKKTKRQKKQTEQNDKQEFDHIKINFKLTTISPLTDSQSETWDAFFSRRNLCLHGYAGTGKTYISLYLALREIIEGNEKYNNIKIVRSVVPTRDMGYLPGSITEKIKIYEDPYRQVCSELFNRQDAYDYLKGKQAIEFISTSFVRGHTFNNCIVIVDEMQNMDWGELSSIITRAGEDCKLIFCGDIMQSDFRFKERVNRDHVIEFMKILKKMDEFKFIEFTVNDIVRSELVKNFIIESTKAGLEIV